MSNTAVPCTHIKQEYWSVSNQKILSENCISIDCFPLLVYLTELDHARNDSDCVLLVVLLVLCGKNLFKMTNDTETKQHELVLELKLVKAMVQVNNAEI